MRARAISLLLDDPMKKVEKYKRYIFTSLILNALGITSTVTMKDTLGSFGIVMIAVGGLLLIIGLNLRKKKLRKKAATNIRNRKKRP